MNPESWFLIGHIVCISQWCAFIMVDYAYLGKGRVRPLWLWTTVLVAGELFLGIKFDIGFFTLLSIWENVGFVLVSTLLFGGTLAQKLTAALINGTMCLLAENTVRYVASWATHTSLLMIWKRMDCLVAMTITNVIVGVLVAYFAHKWKTERALESPQALVMSFFPGITVVLNVVLMISAEDRHADFLMLLLTLGLTVAVLIHMGIVQMFNDQMAQQQALHVQAALERERAEALMDSYTTQRRLTHEFTNHADALALLLQQGEYEEAKAYLATVTKTIAANTTIMDTHNPLLDSILSKKYEEAAQKGVTVYFDLCDLKEIPFDGMDMVIVLSNLLDNAIKYSHEEVKIDIICESEKGFCKIKVCDNGLGIPLKDQSLIFNRFERSAAVGRSGRGGAAGFGLGLNYVQQVMLAHGGRVEVESEEGCFSEFTLYFPIETV